VELNSVSTSDRGSFKQRERERERRKSLTVNRKHRRLADPPCGEVFGDAGVVALMSQLSLPEEQVSIGGLHEAVRGGGHVVGICVGRGGSGAGDGRLERRTIPQPINLGRRYAQRRRAPQFRITAGFHG